MNHIKRIAGVLLALVMVFSLAVTAHAVNGIDGGINTQKHVISVVDPAVGHTYEIYQIFLGDCSVVDGETFLLNVTWGSGVDMSMSIDGKDLPQTLKGNLDFKDCETADDFGRVVSSYNDNSAKLDAFSDTVYGFLSQSCGSVGYLNGEEDPVTSLEVSGDGYYLIVDHCDDISDDAFSNHILLFTDEENEFFRIKSDVPQLSKTIEGTDDTAIAASVGDHIEFELISEVPNMTGYNKYYFVVYDVLSDGLTFNDDISVTVGGKQLTADLVSSTGQIDAMDYYTIENGGVIKIVFRDFYHKFSSSQYTGKEIRITYSATVNENVDLAEGESNVAYLQYSNNPNFTYTGENEPGQDEPVGSTFGSPDGTVRVYSMGIVLNKVNPENESVTGAQFQIKGDTDFPMINNGIFRQSKNGTYYRLKDGTYTQEEPDDSTLVYYESSTVKYEIVTGISESVSSSKIQSLGWVDEDGVITFSGLGEGEYTITEKIAPAGYKLLEKGIPVSVSFTLDSQENPVWTVKIGGQDYTVDEEGYVSFVVENAYKAKLPATGGEGLVGVYSTGMFLVISSVFMLICFSVARRRKK